MAYEGSLLEPKGENAAPYAVRSGFTTTAIHKSSSGKWPLNK